MARVHLPSYTVSADIYRRTTRIACRSRNASRTAPREPPGPSHISQLSNVCPVPRCDLKQTRSTASSFVLCHLRQPSAAPRPTRSGFQLRPRGVSPRPGNRSGGSACYMYRSTLRSPTWTATGRIRVCPWSSTARAPLGPLVSPHPQAVCASPARGRPPRSSRRQCSRSEASQRV